MSNVATATETAVARPLSVLVPLIKEDLRRGDEAAALAGMPFYQAAGEKLREARTHFSSASEFYSWAHRHFERRETQIKLWISYSKEREIPVARATKSSQPLQSSYTSLRDFQRRGLGQSRPSSVHPAPWREDVQTSIDRAKREAERAAAEELTRRQEREEEQKLALRLIDIGYMAKKLNKLHSTGELSFDQYDRALKALDPEAA